MASRDDRIFVRDGRRSHRRRYSLTEFRAGLGVLVLLGAVAAWVAWRGAHPDARLFEAGSLDLAAPPAATPATPAPTTAASAPAADASRAAPAAVARGPLPSALASAGWQEGNVAAFDTTNLYVKIDGREDYYKSFGFRTLWCVTLARDALPGTTVDVELFDLRTAANALGAYAGERAPGSTMHAESDGLWHVARNALFMTRGRYYLRAIGSDESPPVQEELAQLRELFATLPGEPLPWAYALFVGEMNIDPGRIAYTAENAFSFGFAASVWSAKPDSSDMEIFVQAAADPAAARELVARFTAGFLDYGAAAGQSHGVHWVRDRYLGQAAGATASGRWVLGVRSAPDVRRAEQALGALQRAIAAMPTGISPPAATAAAQP
jgi:hypothetical protein